MVLVYNVFSLKLSTRFTCAMFNFDLYPITVRKRFIWVIHLANLFWLWSRVKNSMPRRRWKTRGKPMDTEYYQTKRIKVHYGDVIVGAMASQITSLTAVYSSVYSGADQIKHQSSASLAFVRGIDQWSVNSQHKWPVKRKMFHLMTSSCNAILKTNYKRQIQFHCCQNIYLVV